MTASRLRRSASDGVLAPVVLFLPTLVAFAVSKPGVIWPEYSGIFFHLAFLLVIARLNAPEWARAAGYGWIAFDALTGILAINGLPYDLTWPVRMGGHVLAGILSHWALEAAGAFATADCRSSRW